MRLRGLSLNMLQREELGTAGNTLQPQHPSRIAVLAVAHRQDVKGFLGSMESILASMNCRRTSTDVQEDRLLEAKVTEMRLRLSHKLNIVTLLWWFIICVSLELNMLADSPRWMSATLSWLCLAMLCWHGLPFVFPCMLRRSTVGWWYTISMALAALIESPLCTTMDQSNHMAIMLIALARLPGSVYVSPWLAILCNAALSAQTQWRLQREEQSIAGCPCADVRQKNLMAVSLTFLTVIVSALVVNRSLRNHVRQNIIISKAAKELSAASSLLDLTCDAVLELDDDLQPATQLEGLWFLCQHNPSLQLKAPFAQSLESAPLLHLLLT